VGSSEVRRLVALNAERAGEQQRGEHPLASTRNPKAHRLRAN
jgi:hypothetical protein